MNPKKTTIILLLTILIGWHEARSQTEIVAAGNSASSEAGSISFSIGQIFYVYSAASSGSVSQGVQQAYEIITLSTKGPIKAELQAIVYPNPTQASIYLSIQEENLEAISYQLIDLNGKVISEASIKEAQTFIPMDGLRSSVYILRVYQQNQELKSFKISKN